MATSRERALVPTPDLGKAAPKFSDCGKQRLLKKLRELWRARCIRETLRFETPI